MHIAELVKDFPLHQERERKEGMTGGKKGGKRDYGGKKKGEGSEKEEGSERA